MTVFMTLFSFSFFFVCILFWTLTLDLFLVALMEWLGTVCDGFGEGNEMDCDSIGFVQDSNSTLNAYSTLKWVNGSSTGIVVALTWYTNWYT